MEHRSETEAGQAEPSTREQINRVRRTTFFVVLVGTALFLAGAYWWTVTSATFKFAGALVIPLPMKVAEGGAAMMIAGTALMACAVLVRALAGRCRSCQRRLSRPFSCGSGRMRVSRSLRVCPYCAAPIDDK